MEALIDTRIRASLQMHYVLHGFRSRIRTETAIMELKLAQELARIDQDPLFLVFLDLSNSYDSVDRERLLITPKGCGSGPSMCGLLETFWYCQQLVSIHNGIHEPAFPTSRGKTQGGIISLMLFNVAVDNIIRTCMVMTVENQRVADDGLGETIGWCMGVFYADDGMVGSHGLYWMQHVMNVLVGLFRRYGLAANIAKSRTMTQQSGALRSGISEDAMALKCTEVGDLYRARLRRWIPCLECGVELTVGSMIAHCHSMHRM